MRFEPIWTASAPAVDRLVDPLRPLVHDASNPFADWYFGGTGVAADLIREWTARPSSEYFLGRSLVIYDDACEGGRRPVGCLIALAGDELARCRSADFTAFCQELGPGPEADVVVEQVLASSRALFPPVAQDDLYISRVAIDPAWRGQGFGKALVRQSLELKRAEGFHRFRLDVSAANEAAIRVYEAVGMKIELHSSDPPSGLEYCAMTLTA
jgi:ribosomal protein S18 acetylase RimI-like enzyme